MAKLLSSKMEDDEEEEDQEDEGKRQNKNEAQKIESMGKFFE